MTSRSARAACRPRASPRASSHRRALPRLRSRAPSSSPFSASPSPRAARSSFSAPHSGSSRDPRRSRAGARRVRGGGLRSGERGTLPDADRLPHPFRAFLAGQDRRPDRRSGHVHAGERRPDRPRVAPGGRGLSCTPSARHRSRPRRSPERDLAPADDDEDDHDHVRQAGRAHLHLPLSGPRGLRDGGRFEGASLSAYDLHAPTRMRARQGASTIGPVRSLVAAAVTVCVAAWCESVDASGRTAGATPNGIRLTRPSALLMWGGDSPVLLRAVPEAGSFVLPYRGGWRYDGRQGTLVPAVSAAERIEHPSPTGTLTAIERQSLTPGGYAFSKELAVRDRPGGPERTIYRAPEMFYWLGWSPDGRFVALWEIEQYSGSVDQDGRPLIVIDAANGAQVNLGRTLLFGTTAGRSPHTLAS